MSTKESIISIGVAVLNGATMQIKDTNGRPICNVNVGNGSIILGYTGNTISVQNGKRVTIYELSSSGNSVTPTRVVSI